MPSISLPPFAFNQHSALLLPFVGQGVVAGGWLWARGRRHEVLADQLLGTLLLLLALHVAQWLLGYAGWYDSHDGYSTLMFYVPWTNTLAVGPLVYFYFRALTDHSFRLDRQAWLHFIPALVVAALFPLAALVDLLPGQALPYHFGTEGRLAAALQAVDSFLAAISYASLVWYGTHTLRAFRAYQRYLNDQFSDTDRLSFDWVRRVLLVTAVALVVWLGFGLVDLLRVELSFDQWWFAYLSNGLLVYYLSFAGLQAGGAGHPALLFRPSAEADIPRQPAEAQLPTTEALADANTPPTAAAAEVVRWLPALRELMETQQPWLEPELTLADLAHRLRLAPAVLSKVINAGAGQNFNDFVNTYRVAEARQKLQNPRFAHYTLLAVALESGFNSKSTFNRVFKKLHGVAPSEVERPNS